MSSTSVNKLWCSQIGWWRQALYQLSSLLYGALLYTSSFLSIPKMSSSKHQQWLKRPLCGHRDTVINMYWTEHVLLIFRVRILSIDASSYAEHCPSDQWGHPVQTVIVAVHVSGFWHLSLLVTNGRVHCAGKKPWTRISRQSGSGQTGQRSIWRVPKGWESAQRNGKTSKWRGQHSGECLVSAVEMLSNLTISRPKQIYRVQN